MIDQPQSSLDRILRALFPDESADPAHSAAEADLDAYVTMKLDGRDADARYPHVRPALERFPDLREEYESLKALLADERAGLLVEPSGQAEFDLSFLSRERGLWEIVTAGRQQAIRLRHTIAIRIGQIAASFGSLPPLFTPLLVAVPVRGDEQSTAEALDINLSELEWEPGVSLRLQLGPTQQGEAIISLRVTADDGPSSRKARVALLDEAGQMLISANVDSAGWVTFRDITAGQYTVRVNHAGSTVELPLVVESQAAEP